MKCFYHADKEGVGQCNQCGKVLCKECMNIYRPPLCTECAQEHNNANRRRLVLDVILGTLMMIFGGYMYFTQFAINGFDFFEFIGMVIIWGGIPYGWSALNKITPNIFLFMPIIGWLIYFVIKLFLSLLIGWLAFIVKIVQIVYGIIKNKKMTDYIKNQNI
ncbi:MAG: hypothetical protein E7264_07830 [Lachnospiraceae bacterium]|nr:hypothetical protein [Lachnospiraceae bacterium]